MLASLPDGARLERFLPAIDAEDDDIRSHLGLHRRAAWASTLIAGLELGREGDVALIQEGAFMPIHLRQADAEATATTEPVEVRGEPVPADGMDGRLWTPWGQHH